jgi:hypothetical protein
MQARDKALTAVIFDTILACLLIISFVINCATLGSSDKGDKKKSNRSSNYKQRKEPMYGRVQEE